MRDLIPRVNLVILMLVKERVCTCIYVSQCLSIYIECLSKVITVLFMSEVHVYLYVIEIRSIYPLFHQVFKHEAVDYLNSQFSALYAKNYE